MVDHPGAIQRGKRGARRKERLLRNLSESNGHPPPEPGFARREGHSHRGEGSTRTNTANRRLLKHHPSSLRQQGGGSRGNQGFPVP